MAFFVDPSFFIVLFVSVVVAAVLGLSERPLAPWGMAVSALLLAGLNYQIGRASCRERV